MLDKPGVVPLYRTLKLLTGLDQKVRGVRHEVVGVAVMIARARPHLLCYPPYPLGRCVTGNRGVPSFPRQEAPPTEGQPTREPTL